MMTCREFIDAMLDYDAGAVPEARRSNLRAHEEECAPCADYLRSYRDTTRLCRAALEDPEDPACSDECPDDLVRDVLDSRRKRT